MEGRYFAKLSKLFGEILDYPTAALRRQIEECISLLLSLHRGAADKLSELRTFVGVHPLEEVEEIYTRTFDLQAACYPYVGYHLFGNSNQRALFMAGLMNHYRACRFSAGNELPDHLRVMLRFASVLKRDEREELIRDCVAPAVGKMLAAFQGVPNPYRGVLQALSVVLSEDKDAVTR